MESIEEFDRARRGRLIVVIVLAVAVTAVVVFGVVRLAGAGSEKPGSAPTSSAEATPSLDPSGTPVDLGELTLSEGVESIQELSGQAAIDALGDRIDSVAERNGMTAEELKDLMLHDASVHISVTGTIVYVDPPR